MIISSINYATTLLLNVSFAPNLMLLQ